MSLSGESKTVPRLVIHGGVGRNKSDAEKRIAFHEALAGIIGEGYRVLCEKGARDSVLHCIRLFEDHPLFNAGTGSRLQSDGEARMSASLMDGKSNVFSAVINIRNVRYPIDVAELLSHEKHKVLAGNEATEFARRHGVDFYNPITEVRRKQYLEQRAEAHGTVGAVALDSKGNIVAGTSTGGMGHEIPGRVSDSGTVAGNYASSNVGVSCTGIGEQIVNQAAAAKLATRVDDGMSLRDAVEKSMAEATSFGYQFGLIALDHWGNIEVAKTGGEFFYARHEGQAIETFFR